MCFRGLDAEFLPKLRCERNFRVKVLELLHPLEYYAVELWLVSPCAQVHAVVTPNTTKPLQGF